MQYVDLRMKTFYSDGTASFQEYQLKYQSARTAIERGARLRQLLEEKDGNMRLPIFQSLPYNK